MVKFNAEITTRRTKKKPREAGLLRSCLTRSSSLDVGSLRAFWSTHSLERYALTFLQRLEAIALNGGEVREEVIAASVRRDEAEAFGIVEPFDSASLLGHYMLSKKSR